MRKNGKSSNHKLYSIDLRKKLATYWLHLTRVEGIEVQVVQRVGVLRKAVRVPGQAMHLVVYGFAGVHSDGWATLVLEAIDSIVGSMGNSAIVLGCMHSVSGRTRLAVSLICNMLFCIMSLYIVALLIGRDHMMPSHCTQA